MDITSLSRDKIQAGLDRQESDVQISEQPPRLLFSPTKITEKNFSATCRAYSQLNPEAFKTVVVVESTPGEADKKLAMPSFKVIETYLGEVEANDALRNDFADEDDDFFINDKAFDEHVSLYHQLVMLQCSLKDFTVSHIQITDENSIIIKELASALSEILALKNALIVCCCDLDSANNEEIEKISAFLNEDNTPALMNYLNSRDSNIFGVGSYIAGLLVAKKWGLKVTYETEPENGRIQSGFATINNHPIIG